MTSMEIQYQVDFQSQFAQLWKTQGVFKLQQLDKDQTKHLTRLSGFSENLIKSFETSLKIGTINLFSFLTFV